VDSDVYSGIANCGCDRRQNCTGPRRLQRDTGDEGGGRGRVPRRKRRGRGWRQQPAGEGSSVISGPCSRKERLEDAVHDCAGARHCEESPNSPAPRRTRATAENQGRSGPQLAVVGGLAQRSKHRVGDGRPACRRPIEDACVPAVDPTAKGYRCLGHLISLCAGVRTLGTPTRGGIVRTLQGTVCVVLSKCAATNYGHRDRIRCHMYFPRA